MGRRSTGTLDLHGAHYRLRVQVPKHLRCRFGGQHSLTQVLPTDSKAQANRMKASIVASMLDELRQATRELLSPERFGPIDKQMAFAERLRKQFSGEHVPSITVQAWVMQPSPKRQEAFSDVVLGKATSVETLLPNHIAESARKPRQEADCKRAIRKLIAFMVENDKPTTVEHLTRRMVGEWVTERAKLGHHRKTINKDISFCSGLFRYAIRRGITESNPFSLQSLPKVKVKTKRAWSKSELRKLLRGGGPKWLIDAIKFLALSGMRASELANLRVRNCQKGVFQILDAKGERNRNVPMHSMLLNLVKARCIHKGLDEYLFDEFPTPKNPKIERSQFLTKHFGRYRKSLGLDESNGSRQSAVDLHSLRRYFVTQADVAGNRREDIERVCGHRPQGLSLGLYADPLSIRQMRRVVESVRLPG